VKELSDVPQKIKDTKPPSGSHILEPFFQYQIYPAQSITS
jgi:hypothetical protein